MIQMLKVSKSFISEKHVINAVKNVNIEIRDGEIFGIIGYSGAGKSTVLRMINQLEKQDSGEVVIDGVHINALNEKELRLKRQKIGLIFQHFNLLWSKNVEQNIELPLIFAKVEKKKRKKIVSEFIELVGLKGREKSYPSELSGGQKQRVGIARALANNPKILLCDEATSALDPETTSSILKLLENINKKLNITIVMITHQMEVIQKICHRIAIMDDGNVVEVGDVDSIFKNPQHQTTKKFIHTILNEDVTSIKSELKSYYPNGELLRLVFSNENSDQPILSSVFRALNIDGSIVSSNITHTQKGAVGMLYVHLKDECDSDLFTLELEKRGVVVEKC
ncbi:MAG: methionine ABC transporter ATP-binding protein [Anaerorhabdus sp.]